MHKTLRYTIIFVAAVLLQVFLFDNLNLSPYLYPLVYVGFIVLLPLNINHGLMLCLSLLTGAAVDLLSGTPGLNTIASLASGFTRPAAVDLALGKELARDGVAPLPLTVGRNKWLRYSFLVITIHCMVFFFFEAASFRYAGFTILRSLGSILSTGLFVWFAASFMPAGRAQSLNG